jgi:hypothetical protein
MRVGSADMLGAESQAHHARRNSTQHWESLQQAKKKWKSPEPGFFA